MCKFCREKFGSGDIELAIQAAQAVFYQIFRISAVFRTICSAFTVHGAAGPAAALNQDLADCLKYARMQVPPTRQMSVLNLNHLSILIFAGGLAHAAAATRYAKLGGLSTGQALTPATAWSLATAFTAALPGDTVLVAPGVYPGKYVVTATGTALAPITFLADGAAGTVIIDGTGFAGANDGLIYVNATNGTTRGHLRITGFELRNLTGNDTSGIRLRAGTTGTLTNVEIRNCRIHTILGISAMAITIYGMNGTTSLSNVLVDGCEIWNCQPADSETVAINGNVDSFTVSNCYIHDCNNIGIDAIGGEAGFPAGNPAGKVARNGVIRGNRVERCIAGGPSLGIAAAGIYVDGGQNILIENNIVAECEFGIEVGAENALTTSGITVRQNILTRNRLSGLIFGAPDFSAGTVSGCLFQNNVISLNDTLDEEAAEVQMQAAGANTFENNILHAEGDATLTFLYTDYPAAAALQTFRNNWFYSTLGAAAGSIGWISDSWGYNDFAATGANPGGGFGDPLFVNAAATDYHLQAASPCIDKGFLATNIAAGTLTDIDGFPRVKSAAPDCGADEFHPVDPWFRGMFPGQAISPARILTDSDGDGFSDWQEYATGFSPLDRAQFPSVIMETTGTGSARRARVSWFRGTAATDIVHTLSTSAVPSGFTPVSGLSPAITQENATRQRLTWTLPDSLSAVPRRYFSVSSSTQP